MANRDPTRVCITMNKKKRHHTLKCWLQNNIEIDIRERNQMNANGIKDIQESVF
jgi:hypothetical protein